MLLMERFWTAVTHALNIATLSSFNNVGVPQKPLFGDVSTGLTQSDYGGPVFRPPGRRLRGDGSDFKCDYSNMGLDWHSCSTPEDRSCWIKNNKGGQYDINTNYEDEYPTGILRKYTLVVEDSKYDADGLAFNEAKLFNGSYPGPWLQACWGDEIEINVINKMKHNGTSIHWHGIRQLQTMHMDGVNGVTQCPIAPGDSFVYKWQVLQYGSTWYHSHYALQYADGTVGPMTLHGPTSGNYDEAAKIPLLMTDWGHNSAFEAMYTGLKNQSILLNGHGNVTRYNNSVPALLPIPKPYYNLTFEPFQPSKQPKVPRTRAKRYLLRLINTSFETTFIFSIDNHYLSIVGADFVPIKEYRKTSVLIGIGQRYQIIVEAKPVPNGETEPPEDGNFWMRTFVADCFRKNSTALSLGYEKNGILRYNEDSTTIPTSKAWSNISFACADEPYSDLVPILPWKVGAPSNGHTGEEKDVVLNTNPPRPYPVSAFSFESPYTDSFTPLRIDFDNPIFLNLNNTGAWPDPWIVVPEAYTAKDWVYLILAGNRKQGGSTTGAHPIHLHGHDFALLQQAYNTSFNFKNVHLKFDNPPRRDVVLLPTDGFIIIAFKADNPGSWLMHCHIAAHASEGLALQILEDQKGANAIWPYDNSTAIDVAKETCKNWDAWYGDCENWWAAPGHDPCKRQWFQDDSGI